MSSIYSLSQNAVNQLHIDQNDSGGWGKAALKLGDTLAKLEDELIPLYNNPKENEGKIQEKTFLYQRLMRTFEALRNLFDSIMNTKREMTRSLRVG